MYKRQAFEVGSIEAHGTGTALGDPTEAGALAAVHGLAENPRSVVVGAAKASVGHTEASSGQVGLLRLSEMADVVTGNAQLRSLNPLVGERLGERAGCFVLSLQAVSSQLACGVSSFGYSGTIAHAVLAFGSGGDREVLAFGRDPDASEALAFGARGAEAAGGGVHEVIALRSRGAEEAGGGVGEVLALRSRGAEELSLIHI